MTVYYAHPLGEYSVIKTRYGLYTSVLKEGDVSLVTGLTEEAVRIATEYIHLPFHYGNDSSDIKTTVTNVAAHVPL